MLIPGAAEQTYWARLQKLVDDLGIGEYTPLSYEDALYRETLGVDNIVGLSLGEKEVQGHPQGVPAVQVLVVRKVVEEQVNPQFLAEKLVDYFFEGRIVSDVVEVGRPTSLHHQTRDLRPHIPGGAAISDNVSTDLGTLGAWVTDGNDYYLLTCSHCLDHRAQSVLQPPGGKTAATITARVDPNPSAAVSIDAAIGQVDSSVTPAHFLLRLGEIRGTKRVGTTYYSVRKSGAKTHLTKGGVTGVGAVVTLIVNGQPTRYAGQLRITPNGSEGPFADGGDSGSVVLSEDGYAVGLLVGGDPTVPSAFATPIDDVLRALGAQMSPARRLYFLSYP